MRAERQPATEAEAWQIAMHGALSGGKSADEAFAIADRIAAGYARRYPRVTSSPDVREPRKPRAPRTRGKKT